MCSIWYVFYMVCDLYGMCYIWYVLYMVCRKSGIPLIVLFHVQTKEVVCHNAHIMSNVDNVS